MGFYCRVAVAVVVVVMLTPTSRSQDDRTGQYCGSCVSGPHGLTPVTVATTVSLATMVSLATSALLVVMARKETGGETGSPGTAARARVKQCFWNNLNNDADSGKIVDCQFNKASSTTALRLTWNGDLRYHGSVNGSVSGCQRWFFTVNGMECSNPAPIDGVVNTYGFNIHRVSTIDGVCYNLPVGPLTVAFHVGRCADGHAGGDATTGWNSYSRVILEELDMAD